MLYWLLKYVLLGVPVRLLFRPKVVGLENIPASGPVLLAGNHLAFIDSLFMPVMVPRRVTFLAKAEYFSGGKSTTPLMARLIAKGTGQVPIDRSGASASADAIRVGLSVLDANKVLCLYPEGTRSPDGRLYKGKTGLARLALAAGVPVVPVAMVGTQDVNRVGSKRWRLAPTEIRIGKPLDLSRFEGMGGSRIIERTVTDEVMYALMELSGQEYVDMYAADFKAGMLENAVRASLPAA